MWEQILSNKGSIGILNSKRRDGFTLLEVIIAVVVLGIISSLVVVNWSRSIAYQNLRRESVSMWRELSALKPVAHRDGIIIFVTFNTANSSYTIDYGNGNTVTRQLPGGINLNSGRPSGIINDPPGDIAPNKWQTNPSRLEVSPDNINTFNEGRMYLICNRSGRSFCLQKPDGVINLQLFAQRGNQWTQM